MSLEYDRYRENKNRDWLIGMKASAENTLPNPTQPISTTQSFGTAFGLAGISTGTTVNREVVDLDQSAFDTFMNAVLPDTWRTYLSGLNLDDFIEGTTNAVWTFISGVQSALSTASLTSAFQSAASWIAGIWNGLTDAVRDVIDDTLKWLGELWGNLTATVQGLLKDAVKWIAETWNDLGATLRGVAQAAVKWAVGLYNTAKTHIDNLIDFFGDLGSDAAAALTAFGAKVTSFLGDVWTNLSGFFGDLGATAADRLAAFGAKVTEFLGDAWTTITDFLGDTATKVAAAATTIANKLFNNVTTIGTQIQTALGNVTDSFWAWITGLFNIDTTEDGTITALGFRTIIGHLKTFLGSATSLTSVAGIATQVINRILDNVTDIAEKLADKIFEYTGINAKIDEWWGSSEDDQVEWLHTNLTASNRLVLSALFPIQTVVFTTAENLLDGEDSDGNHISFETIGEWFSNKAREVWSALNGVQFAYADRGDEDNTEALAYVNSLYTLIHGGRSVDINNDETIVVEKDSTVTNRTGGGDIDMGTYDIRRVDRIFFESNDEIDLSSDVSQLSVYNNTFAFFAPADNDQIAIFMDVNETENEDETITYTADFIFEVQKELIKNIKPAQFSRHIILTNDTGVTTYTPSSVDNGMIWLDGDDIKVQTGNGEKSLSTIGTTSAPAPDISWGALAQSIIPNNTSRDLGDTTNYWQDIYGKVFHIAAAEARTTGLANGDIWLDGTNIKVQTGNGTKSLSDIGSASSTVTESTVAGWITDDVVTSLASTTKIPVMSSDTDIGYITWSSMQNYISISSTILSSAISGLSEAALTGGTSFHLPIVLANDDIYKITGSAFLTAALHSRFFNSVDDGTTNALVYKSNAAGTSKTFGLMDINDIIASVTGVTESTVAGWANDELDSVLGTNKVMILDGSDLKYASVTDVVSAGGNVSSNALTINNDLNINGFDLYNIENLRFQNDTDSNPVRIFSETVSAISISASHSVVPSKFGLADNKYWIVDNGTTQSDGTRTYRISAFSLSGTRLEADDIVITGVASNALIRGMVSSKGFLFTLHANDTVVKRNLDGTSEIYTINKYTTGSNTDFNDNRIAVLVNDAGTPLKLISFSRPYMYFYEYDSTNNEFDYEGRVSLPSNTYDLSLLDAMYLRSPGNFDILIRRSATDSARAVHYTYDPEDSSSRLTRIDSYTLAIRNPVGIAYDGTYHILNAASASTPEVHRYTGDFVLRGILESSMAFDLSGDSEFKFNANDNKLLSITGDDSAVTLSTDSDELHFAIGSSSKFNISDEGITLQNLSIANLQDDLNFDGHGLTNIDQIRFLNDTEAIPNRIFGSRSGTTEVAGITFNNAVQNIAVSENHIWNLVGNTIRAWTLDGVRVSGRDITLPRHTSIPSPEGDIVAIYRGLAYENGYLYIIEAADDGLYKQPISGGSPTIYHIANTTVSFRSSIRAISHHNNFLYMAVLETSPDQGMRVHRREFRNNRYSTPSEVPSYWAGRTAKANDIRGFVVTSDNYNIYLEHQPSVGYGRIRTYLRSGLLANRAGNQNASTAYTNVSTLALSPDGQTLYAGDATQNLLVSYSRSGSLNDITWEHVRTVSMNFQLPDNGIFKFGKNETDNYSLTYDLSNGFLKSPGDLTIEADRLELRNVTRYRLKDGGTLVRNGDVVLDGDHVKIMSGDNIINLSEVQTS